MKKYFYPFTFACLLAVTLPVDAQSLAPQPLGDNLVQNAGFESGAAPWKIESKQANIASGVGRSGERSLHYVNTDPKIYKMFAQEINVSPGQHVRFSAWVKGKNIDAKAAKGMFAQGAGIYMQSYDGDKYIKGIFPAGLQGTFDWQKITASYIVPSNATRTSVGVYLRQGVVGEAWFDDVEVRVEKPIPLGSFLQYPNYRGMVPQGDSAPWKYAIDMDPEQMRAKSPISVSTVLTDSAGKVLLEEKSTFPGDRKTASVTVEPPKGLPLGNYTLAQRFTGADGKELFANENAIQVVEKMPRVYVDAQGFTVVEGKRFFPMGIFLGPTSSEHLERIAAGGFNTILTYGYGDNRGYKSYMDRAAKHNLKVIYEVKNMYPGSRNYGDEAYEIAEKYVKELRDNPHLLAWYTNDELTTDWAPQLQEMYNRIKRLDPHHPTFQVESNNQVLDKYFDTTDILSPTTYPVGRPGRTDLASASAHTRAYMRAAHGAKGVWVVPQLMDWAVYRKGWEQHPPSLDEMRNLAYQALINGATGLIWYAYRDLHYEKAPRNETTRNPELFAKRWQDVVTMIKEVNALVPVVLEGDNKIELNLPAGAPIEASALQDGNQLLLLLANPYYEAKSITIDLPEKWQIKEAVQGGIKGTLANGKLTLTLPSVGSGIFRLDSK